MVAPDGTVAVICVSELTVYEARKLLNVTAVAPVKLLPVITTVVPGKPEVGEKDAIAGAAANTGTAESSARVSDASREAAREAFKSGGRWKLRQVTVQSLIFRF